MKNSFGLILLLLILNIGTILGKWEEQLKLKGEEQSKKVEQVYDIAENESINKNENKRQGKILFAIYSSTTALRLTTVTKGILSTCYSTSPGALTCNGRRRRRQLGLVQEVQKAAELYSSDSELDSTLAENESGLSRSGRKLTFWSTAYSTLTVTTNSYISGTTVRVTAKCNILGVLDTPFCGYIDFD